jgi:hypothetical protein
MAPGRQTALHLRADGPAGGRPRRTPIGHSHGYFVNRRLEMSNSTILEDRPFRGDIGIELEAYDET